MRVTTQPSVPRLDTELSPADGGGSSLMGTSSVFQTCLLHRDPLFWIPRVTGRLPAVRGRPSPNPSPTRVPTAVLFAQVPTPAAAALVGPGLYNSSLGNALLFFFLSESKYLKSRAGWLGHSLQMVQGQRSEPTGNTAPGHSWSLWLAWPGGRQDGCHSAGRGVALNVPFCPPALWLARTAVFFEVFWFSAT